MQLMMTLITGILSGFTAAWLSYQNGEGWLLVILSYVAGGNLGFAMCYVLTSAFTLFDDT